MLATRAEKKHCEGSPLPRLPPPEVEAFFGRGGWSFLARPPLLGPRGVGIAHAGWRGASAGVVGALRRAMDREGIAAERACIGPGIRSCCFEVGPEVLARFQGHHASTTWGTPSVDIVGALRDELAGLEIIESGECTRCGVGYFSHRRDGTRDRMAGVAWLE